MRLTLFFFDLESRTRKHKPRYQGRKLMWTKPVVREVAVGLEINCYACAEL